ncbi:MAG TPA: TrkA C-terminal domain-containing protein, partial [Thermoanaerobaculia bacterium]|nr:TrkA C-terminal domain-containing protein [Thermoanaerobaculia bacterium]
TSTQLLDGDVVSFHIDPALPVANVALEDVPFPEGATVMLIVRGDHLIAPRGQELFLPGDHVYVFCRPEDRELLGLMFGRAEE